MDMENLVNEITEKVILHLANKTNDNKPHNKTNFYYPINQQNNRNTIITSSEIARLIDHTLLNPEATEEDIKKLCSEAKEYHFSSICVNPYWVSTAVEELTGSKVNVKTVIGYPFGVTSTFSKVAEARDAIASGANELEVVINLGAFKNGDYHFVKEDLERVIQCTNKQALVNVIIETHYLTNEEIQKACLIAKMAGAHFISISMNFTSGKTTIDEIKLMREAIGQNIGIKVSGEVNCIDTAREFIWAGANRIGTSAGIKIINS